MEFTPTGSYRPAPPKKTTVLENDSACHSKKSPKVKAIDDLYNSYFLKKAGSEHPKFIEKTSIQNIILNTFLILSILSEKFEGKESAEKPHENAKDISTLYLRLNLISDTKDFYNISKKCNRLSEEKAKVDYAVFHNQLTDFTNYLKLTDKEDFIKYIEETDKVYKNFLHKISCNANAAIEPLFICIKHLFYTLISLIKREYNKMDILTSRTELTRELANCFIYEIENNKAKKEPLSSNI